MLRPQLGYVDLPLLWCPETSGQRNVGKKICKFSLLQQNMARVHALLREMKK